MTTFTLPESYRTYLKDAAAQSAVDHLLASATPEVPACLEWDQLPDFHAAALAAHQVQCNFATALHGLWNKVWQSALDHCSFADSLEPLSFNERQKYSVHWYDPHSLWHGPLERVYDTGDHSVGLGVTTDFKQAWLTIRLFNGNGENLTTGLATDLAQGGDWQSQPDEGYLLSREKLAPISDGGIMLDPLNRAAEKALQQIVRRLDGPQQR